MYSLFYVLNGTLVLLLKAVALLANGKWFGSTFLFFFLPHLVCFNKVLYPGVLADAYLREYQAI